MRSISPVIATVILLLITVAAGALAYLTITGFQDQTQTGAEGSFEQLSESTQSGLRIESVNSGKVYLRNIGSVPLSRFRAYVAGQPCREITCPEQLDPKGANVCDINCPIPDCPTGYIEITIGSGGASETTRVKCEQLQDTTGPSITIEHSPFYPMTNETISFNATVSDAENGNNNITGCNIKLDSNSWQAMSAYDGAYDEVTETANYTFSPQSLGTHITYVECNDTSNNTGSATQSVSVTTCGNGVCESYENRFSCMSDCGPAIIIAALAFTTPSVSDVYSFIYNGTEWVMDQNITHTPGENETSAVGIYDSNGNFMTTWTYNAIGYSNCNYSIWDNSTDTWSSIGIVNSQNGTSPNREMAADTSGNIMMVMQDRSGLTGDMIMSTLWDGSSWGPLYNVSLSSDYDLGIGYKFPDIGYYYTTPIAVWQAGSSSSYPYAQSATWSGSAWTNQQNISTTCDWAYGRTSVTTNRNGPVMAAWSDYILDTGNYQIRSAQWNGTGWANQQNVTGELNSYLRGIDISRDTQGNNIGTYFMYNGAADYAYFVLHKDGSWGTPQLIGGPIKYQVVGIYDKIPDTIILGWLEDHTDHYEYKLRIWDPTTESFGPAETVLRCTGPGGILSGIICTEV